MSKDEQHVPTPEEEYESRWDELENEEGDPSVKKPDPEPDPEDNTKNTGDEPAPGKAGEGKEGEVKEPDPDKKKDDVKDPDHGPLESMRKALDDTKAYARKLEDKLSKKDQEAKAFKKEKEAKASQDLEALKKGITEDYPEMVPVIERLMSEINDLKKVNTKGGTEEPEGDEEPTDREKAAKVFEEKIKPEVDKVHSDFEAIVKSEEYWKWVEKQPPAMQFAAAYSSEPQDIIMAVSSYKRDLGSEEAKKLKEKEEKERDKKIKAAQSMRGGRTPMPQRKGDDSKDPNDYDGGWDDAAKLLEKEGVR